MGDVEFFALLDRSASRRQIMAIAAHRDIPAGDLGRCGGAANAGERRRQRHATRRGPCDIGARAFAGRRLEGAI